MANSMFFKYLLFAAALLPLLFISGCVGDKTAEPPAYNPNPILEKPLYDTDSSSPVYALVPTKPLELAFINVGYGDATLIRSQGKTILFDTGPDENAAVLGEYLKKAGITKIDILVLSSDDPAFVGGAPEILRNFEVIQIWTNGNKYSGANWEMITKLSENIQKKEVEYGNKFEDNNFSLTVLNPFPGLRNADSDMDSIVLKAQYNNFCALLFSNSEASGAAGSDAGTVSGGVDNRVISGSIPIECKVLKVSHHGSGNTASFELLERMKPEAAIISVGPNPPENKYPETTLIRRLLLKNIGVYLTDKLGTITVKTSGDGYEVQTEFARDTSYAAFINNIGYGRQKYYG